MKAILTIIVKKNIRINKERIANKVTNVYIRQ